MKNATVILKDYVNPGKDGLNERITLVIPEGEKLIDTAIQWMKNSYGGTIYTELNYAPKLGKHIRMIFSTKSDFFLSYPVKQG